MKPQNLTILLLALLFQLSCQKQNQILSSEWIEGSLTSPPTIPDTKEFDNKTFQLKNQELFIGSQKFNGVLLEDSFIKTIKENENPIYIAFKTVVPEQLIKKAEIYLLHLKKAKMLKRLKNLNIDLKDQRVIGSELVTRFEFNLIPTWRFDFENQEGIISSYYVTSEFSVIKKIIAGSKASEALAYIFPYGPNKSEITQVPLSRLISPQFLESSEIVSHSMSPLQATANGNQFTFPIDDHRFFQVQAYYFVDKSLRWFESEFGFKSSDRISVETSLGYPDKTNTAFYFKNTIRLGDGDDQVFSKIPLDPSIAIHESVHFITDTLAKLPFTGEGGSLNEGFADFFTALQLKNPNIGEVSYKKGTFKRSVKNQLKYHERNGGLYHDSGIISGLLWQIKTETDDHFSAHLAWEILIRLNPTSNFSTFKEVLLNILRKESSENQSKVKEVLKDREWVI